MNTKLTSLFAGIALLAGVGMANAEERLSAASMDEVTAAGYKIYHGHPHHPHVRGTDASASTVALCFGSPNCDTSATATAVVDHNSSISAATATASNH